MTGLRDNDGWLMRQIEGYLRQVKGKLDYRIGDGAFGSNAITGSKIGTSNLV